MSKRQVIQKHIKHNAALMAKKANQEAKYRKIQTQFNERSNVRFEGKRVRTEDVIQELSNEWCLSVARIEAIIRMQL